eukprot:CAMPEP_0204523500 /NCGR_PEP_ID=MMETSP0661-20131031/6872_1 /ASSEMBLY_ACC=CAM_ASM_000606 /TAXON_ID=109239 /ORGANISM="Alexandrium margalefi, Strain AMGDE01CS-322" /LENGTH=226 /DNA_ID=CAMNT_0051529199 /DNA_START=153 /DNA_END=834 /DNA_ORIENTATION=+
MTRKRLHCPALELLHADGSSAHGLLRPRRESRSGGVGKPHEDKAEAGGPHTYRSGRHRWPLARAREQDLLHGAEALKVPPQECWGIETQAADLADHDHAPRVAAVQPPEVRGDLHPAEPAPARPMGSRGGTGSLKVTFLLQKLRKVFSTPATAVRTAGCCLHACAGDPAAAVGANTSLGGGGARPLKAEYETSGEGVRLRAKAVLSLNSSCRQEEEACATSPEPQL